MGATHEFLYRAVQQLVRRRHSRGLPGPNCGAAQQCKSLLAPLRETCTYRAKPSLLIRRRILRAGAHCQNARDASLRVRRQELTMTDVTLKRSATFVTVITLIALVAVAAALAT